MSEVQERPFGADGGAMPLSGDLLHGADEIARFVYGSAADERAAESNRRKIYNAAERHGLPTFKFGGTITARRSTILRWIEAQEQASETRPRAEASDAPAPQKRRAGRGRA